MKAHSAVWNIGFQRFISARTLLRRNRRLGERKVSKIYFLVLSPHYDPLMTPTLVSGITMKRVCDTHLNGTPSLFSRLHYVYGALHAGYRYIDFLSV